MILDEQKRREFSAFLNLEYGIETSSSDPVLAILYLMNDNSEKQAATIDKLVKMTDAKSSSKAIVLDTPEAAKAYVDAKAANYRQVLGRIIAIASIAFLIVFSFWYFISIQSKYDYILKYERTQSEPPKK